MKLNYKAIGLYIQFVREALDKRLEDLELFLGPEHAGKLISYEAGSEIEKQTLIKICDYFKRFRFGSPIQSKFYDIYYIQSFGDVKQFPNILSLFIQQKINTSRLKKGYICREILNVSTETLSHWISGKHYPQGHSISPLTIFLNLGYHLIEKLVSKSKF